MQKIIPALWFNGNAEEAVNFYVSLFPDSRINKLSHYTKAGPEPEGTVMMIDFSLSGQDFLAINAGPDFSFSSAISFLVNCEDQAEIDRLWDKLAVGGKPMVCGWIVDKFGVTWQITPIALREMMSDKDKVKAERVARAMFPMVKLDLAKLKQAYEQ